MEKKQRLGKIIKNVGGKMSDALNQAKEKVVNAVDQDDDGKFDVKDVQLMAGALGDKAKNAVSDVKAKLDEKAKEKELNELMPIFEDDLSSADFQMSRLIRITDVDEKHQKSELCRGSIGHYSVYKEKGDWKGWEIINIYRSALSKFGIRLFPDKNEELYYIDPINPNVFLSLNQYFDWIRQERVNEMVRVAQSLGAKYYKISLMETTSVENRRRARGTAKAGAMNADAEMDSNAQSYTSTKIVSTNEFPGHDPVEPELYYLKKEPAVVNLIKMRMAPQNPILQQTFKVATRQQSGIDSSMAAKIDGAVKALKIKSSVNLEEKAAREEQYMFEYEVRF